MNTYKPLVLFNLLTELYPDTPICCNTTYSSILLHNTSKPLVPEETIIDSYPSYVQKYNLNILRTCRNNILSSCDKYALSDYPFPDDATKQAWQAYRQALRDITKVYPNPIVDENDYLIGITWPISPNGDTGPVPRPRPMLPPMLPPMPAYL
jgi:hypothetical protein